MKFILSFVAVIAATLSLTACPSTPTTPGAPPSPSPVAPVVCSLEQSLSGGLAKAAGDYLNCQPAGVALLQADLLTSIGKVNLCATLTAKRSMKGPIGNLLCPMAVSAAQSVLTDQVTGKIPAKYLCDPTAAVGNIAQVFSNVCTQYVTF